MLLIWIASWFAFVQQRRFNMIISENCNIIIFLTFPSCVEISVEKYRLTQKNFPDKNCYIIEKLRFDRKCQSARSAKKKSTSVSFDSDSEKRFLVASDDDILAEKVTSLGKDWHRPCLRCEKCNKVGKKLTRQKKFNMTKF